MPVFVYILRSEKDGSFYIGTSQNVKERLVRHNSGWERYTKSKRPWVLLWYNEKASRSEAFQLERKIKNLKSRDRILDFIKRNAGRDGTASIEDAQSES